MPRSKTRKKKAPEDLRINQGAYSSYNKAKQRVAINHQNAYSHVEFRFELYEQFLAEIGPCPEGKTLDRIDVNGHYEPGNVRWATHKEQCRNKRNNVILEYNGKKMCLEDASKASGISSCALRDRIKTTVLKIFYSTKDAGVTGMADWPTSLKKTSLKGKLVYTKSANLWPK